MTQEEKVKIPTSLLREMNNMCLEALSLPGLPAGVRKRFRALVIITHQLLHRELPKNIELEFDLD